MNQGVQNWMHELELLADQNLIHCESSQHFVHASIRKPVMCALLKPETRGKSSESLPTALAVVAAL